MINWQKTAGIILIVGLIAFSIFQFIENKRIESDKKDLNTQLAKIRINAIESNQERLDSILKLNKTIDILLLEIQAENEDIQERINENLNNYENDINSVDTITRSDTLKKLLSDILSRNRGNGQR